jgi:hypothetical protein
MSTQKWDVDVAGTRHVVTVDYDWQDGRATIRVNGRLSVKPLTHGETERDVPIGTAHYIIRRLDDDTFDLDVAPETFLNPIAAAAPRQGRPTVPGKRLPKESPGIGRRILTIIGGIVGALVILSVVLGIFRAGKRVSQYASVPWMPYSAADSTFKAKFPELQPKEEAESHNINGDLWNIVSVTSHYKDHFYAVQYLDLHMVVTESGQRGIMNRFFDGWMKGLTASVEKKEEGTLARNPTIEYVARIPPGVGDKEVKLPVAAKMRGIMALRDKRLFLVWTLAAEADPVSSDLQEFITAFTVPPPPERPHALVL